MGLQVAAAYSTAYAYHDLSRYPEAIELLQKNIDILTGELMRERFGFPQLPSVSSRNLLAWCRAWQGDFAEGLRLLEESSAIAETVDHAGTKSNMANGFGLFNLLQGDVQAAVEGAGAGAEHPSSCAHPGSEHRLLPGPRLYAGRTRTRGPSAVRAVTGGGGRHQVPALQLALDRLVGRGLSRGGRPAEATDLAVRALEISRTQKERGYEAYALRLMGDIATRSDQPQVARAESAYTEAIALATILGMRPLLARSHLGLGRLYGRVGDRARALEELNRAAGMLGAMNMPLWLGEAKTELATLA